MSSVQPRCELDRPYALDLIVGSVFRDEAPYLREWIEFHKMMGVQRFLLVNDRSSDAFEDVLRPYMDAGEVDLVDQPCPSDLQGRGWIQYQLAVTCAIVERARGLTQWLALIDLDEFIVPADAGNLIELLADFESYSGIYVRWEPFGTSYVARLSDHDLVTERLRLKWRFREGDEMLGKSIIRPHRVARPNIHRCDLLPGDRYADSNPGMKDPDPPIRINHYWSRDEHFLFNVKLPRTCEIKGWELDEEKVEYFRNLFNDVPDTSMDRFIPELRRRLAVGEAFAPPGFSLQRTTARSDAISVEDSPFRPAWDRST